MKHLLGIDLFFQFKEIRFFTFFFEIGSRRFDVHDTSHWFSKVLVRSIHEKSWKYFEASREVPRDRVDGRLAGLPVYDRDVKRYNVPFLPRCAPRLDDTPHEASLMRHRYLWGYLHIAKHIEPGQMAAGTRETPEYSSR